jgi:hypothetical protein
MINLETIALIMVLCIALTIGAGWIIERLLKKAIEANERRG